MNRRKFLKFSAFGLFHFLYAKDKKVRNKKLCLNIVSYHNKKLRYNGCFFKNNKLIESECIKLDFVFQDRRTKQIKKIDRKLYVRLAILQKRLKNEKFYLISGYRSEKSNSIVGGAKKSQHKLGKAADILVINNKNKLYLEACKFKKGGVGKYKIFTHIDVRNYKARW